MVTPKIPITHHPTLTPVKNSRALIPVNFHGIRPTHVFHWGDSVGFSPWVWLVERDRGHLAHEIAERLCKWQPEREVNFIIQPGIMVRGDESLLRIALENLLDNSWKYTSKHTVANIEFGLKMVDRNPVYYVKDDGAGFDMKYSQKLFGAFQRMHTTEEFPGTGIGLATVQRIINRHGGKIWAESEVDKGTTFCFSIPMKEKENEAQINIIS